MKWTSKHQKLLLALRAEQVIPKLVRRLSFERHVATEEDLLRLSAWPEALSQSEGWAHIKAMLDRPESWPSAWHHATSMGWSNKADHHNALFFDELSRRFLKEENYESALWSWTECIGAWSRVFGSTYPESLLKDLAPEADEDALAQYRLTLEHLLEPLVTAQSRALKEALRLDDNQRRDESLDKRKARFAWSALDLLQVIFSQQEQDSFGAMHYTSRLARRAQEHVRQEAANRFERMVSALDLTQVESEALLVPFEWITQIYELLGADAQAHLSVVEHTVELGWSLRRLGRDDDNKDFEHILAITRPHNDALMASIKALETFGHNSKCADFLVFMGELSDDPDERKAIFEQGMLVCPGHRNSAMLLSYEYLNDIHALILQLKLVPGTVSRTFKPSKSVEETVLSAWTKLQRVEELFPTNKKLEEYEARVQAVAKRLGVTLPQRSNPHQEREP